MGNAPNLGPTSLKQVASGPEYLDVVKTLLGLNQTRLLLGLHHCTSEDNQMELSCICNIILHVRWNSPRLKRMVSESYDCTYGPP